MDETCEANGCFNLASEGGYCEDHLDIEADRALDESDSEPMEREAFEEEKESSEEESNTAEQDQPQETSETQESTEKTSTQEQLKRFEAKARARLERASWAAKGLIATVTNPVFWVSVLVVFLVYITANVATTSHQTFGQLESAQAGAGMSDEVLGRLAQRALFLAEHNHNFDTSDQFVVAYGGEPRTNNNPWAIACPDIVNIIYGLPPNYIGNNGSVNAWENYKRAVAAGLTPTAWWFPSTASPGAQQNAPPAGAIVSSLSNTSSAGHTWVMLTDEIVIDNSAVVNGSVPSREYRTFDPGGQTITGWFVPPDEGYEGEHLNDVPGLPAVPDWAGTSSSS